MLSINFWNILWTVVNLLVLYVVFRKFLYQRVMNVIEAREEMVKKQSTCKEKRRRCQKIKGRLENAYRMQERRQTRLLLMPEQEQKKSMHAR